MPGRTYPLLTQVDLPQDLRALDVAQLPQLVTLIRRLAIQAQSVDVEKR